VCCRSPPSHAHSLSRADFFVNGSAERSQQTRSEGKDPQKRKGRHQPQTQSHVHRWGSLPPHPLRPWQRPPPLPSPAQPHRRDGDGGGGGGAAVPPLACHPPAPPQRCRPVANGAPPPPPAAATPSPDAAPPRTAFASASADAPSAAPAAATTRRAAPRTPPAERPAGAAAPPAPRPAAAAAAPRAAAAPSARRPSVVTSARRRRPPRGSGATVATAAPAPAPARSCAPFTDGAAHPTRRRRRGGGAAACPAATAASGAARRAARARPRGGRRRRHPRGTRRGDRGAVLLKAWAHASSKSARFGLQELVGTPLTVPCGPILSTSGLQQGFARIALVKFISQEASRGGADCECKRTRFHAAELRFRVRQQPHVSNPARILR